jgi:hypothetical protein
VFAPLARGSVPLNRHPVIGAGAAAATRRRVSPGAGLALRRCDDRHAVGAELRAVMQNDAPPLVVSLLGQQR